jgi:DNA recombination protein RmuC
MYQHLLNAYDSGDRNEIDAASRDLYARIRQEAKKIRDKYVQVPATTDFAIMFLPVEGLYAEAVRIGAVDEVQRLYKVSIAGPTTMAALLNSLQMGFRTLAIQKRSSEVWKVLGEVRAEFETFFAVLETAQNRIVKANEELDKLIGVRTRQIQRKLKDVSQFSSSDQELLDPPE